MGNTFQYVFLHSNNHLLYLGCSTIYYRISYSLSLIPTLDTVLRCHKVSVKVEELSAQPEMLIHSYTSPLCRNLWWLSCCKISSQTHQMTHITRKYHLHQKSLQILLSQIGYRPSFLCLRL